MSGVAIGMRGYAAFGVVAEEYFLELAAGWFGESVAFGSLEIAVSRLITNSNSNTGCIGFVQLT